MQFTAMTVADWDAAWKNPDRWEPHSNFAPVYTSHTMMFNWLGFPAISVPCGFHEDLPIGLQIVGMPNSEDKNLQAAAAFLKAFPRNERPHLAEIARLKRHSMPARHYRLPAARGGQANRLEDDAAREKNREE